MLSLPGHALVTCVLRWLLVTMPSLAGSFFLFDLILYLFFFFFQAEDGIRDLIVTGVQTCALPISPATLPYRVRKLEENQDEIRTKTVPELLSQGRAWHSALMMKLAEVDRQLVQLDRKSVV